MAKGISTARKSEGKWEPHPYPNSIDPSLEPEPQAYPRRPPKWSRTYSLRSRNIVPKRRREKKVEFRLKNGLLNLSVTTETQASITSRNSAASRLLGLPAEIRNRIFGYALGGARIHVTRELIEHVDVLGSTIYPLPDPIPASSIPSPSNDVAATLSTFPIPRAREHYNALPLVCRQLYAETATLTYSHNTFSFGSERALYTWHAHRQRIPAQLYAVTSITAGCTMLGNAYKALKIRKPRAYLQEDG